MGQRSACRREAREAKVISDAVEAGESRGLKSDELSHFFRAHIEANKLVQYSLLADWRRIGEAPEHQPVKLSLASSKARSIGARNDWRIKRGGDHPCQSLMQQLHRKSRWQIRIRSRESNRQPQSNSS